MQLADYKIVNAVIKQIVDKMNIDYSIAIAYYYGTPLETNNIRQRDVATDGVKLKYPFIALLEPIEIEHIFDESSPILGIANCWIVLMTDADFTNWTTKEHYDNAIIPMNELLQKFLTTLESKIDSTIGRPISMTRIDHAKWGLIARMSGHTVNVFADNLSGVELTNFRIPILKEWEC
jgi:hypothetical protein